MEADLNVKEMSSVRQSTDERNSSEEETKADQSVHSDPLMQEMGRRKKKTGSTLSLLPGRGHLSSQLHAERGQMCARCNIPFVIVNKIAA